MESNLQPRAPRFQSFPTHTFGRAKELGIVRIVSAIRCIITCPDQCGNSGKLSVVRNLSCSAADWVVVDDSAVIIQEVTEGGGFGVRIFRGGAWAPEGSPYRYELADCQQVIADQRNKDY